VSLDSGAIDDIIGKDNLLGESDFIVIGRGESVCIVIGRRESVCIVIGNDQRANIALK